MKTIGRLVTLLGIAAAVGAAIVTVKSVPDVQRYRRMRAM
ncbi:MAG: hypothetical protein JWN96_4103 [Mycobacterium sp.]|jgi:hypothetical protein|nr:hypothetical protein [Mycobacterium sp.]